MQRPKYILAEGPGPSGGRKGHMVRRATKILVPDKILQLLTQELGQYQTAA